DGFRFDLAYTLGREGSDGRSFSSTAQTLEDIAQLGDDESVKMVAEAWDTSGYGVGQFPSDWSEWNGYWRDNLRRYIKGDSSQVGNLGASITGSWSGFAIPEESVNFVTAHDGFTLNDLVSYNSKQNGTGACNPTGADPSSGSSSNDSWDSGGDEALRRRQIRNFAANLFLHHGIPMILGGDEFRNTQSGNNNAYMADNSCGWLNWSDPVTHAKTREVFRRLIGLRKAHPGLRRAVTVAGSDHDSDGYPDLGWHGTSVGSPDWSSGSHTLAYLIDGSSSETGGGSDAPDLYVASNAYWSDLTFNLPTAPNSKCWFLVADTGDWAEGTGNVYYDPSVTSWSSQSLWKVTGTSWGLQARSTLILAARSCSDTQPTRVDFTVYGYSTSPGQDIYVVGNVAELGNWDPAKAVKLNYVSSNQWSGPVFFNTSKGSSIQYKYIVRSSSGTTWEGGSNRSYSVPSSGNYSQSGTWQ
ncbi:MAG: hypothetical protein KDD11_13550, partial [Acidobacteria bacterium]|nr:hypothetical protein [Acidobacteriota bacterium]